MSLTKVRQQVAERWSRCGQQCPLSRAQSAERAGTEVGFAAHAGPHAAVIPLLSVSGLDTAALALANLHNNINIFTSTFALQGIFLNSKNDCVF